jgi:hypothetical protein
MESTAVRVSPLLSFLNNAHIMLKWYLSAMVSGLLHEI